MSKLKVDYQKIIERFYEETKLLGIVAPMEGYKLCWQINKLLSFDFRVVPEMELSMEKKGRKYFYPLYVYNQPGNSAAHFLYANRNDGEYLLPEFQHFDYLWLTKFNQVDEEEVKTFVAALRSLSFLQVITELPLEKIKNKENLFF